MSILKRKKIIKLSLFTAASIASVGTISSYIGLSSSNSSVSKVSSSTQADVQATADGSDTATSNNTDSYTKYNAPSTESKNIDNTKMTLYPFDMSKETSSQSASKVSSLDKYDTSKATIPTILQNTATDDTNNTGYASFVKYNDKDAIARFTSVNTTIPSSTSGGVATSDKYAGQTEWVVTSDDLIKLAYKAINSSDMPESSASNYTLNFKSMLFSVGGADSPPSLFVIAKINDSSSGNNLNGSYLFQINWDNSSSLNVNTSSSSSSTTSNAGYFRLAARLSSGSSFTDYNYLVMDAISTNTMQAMYLSNITGTTTSDSKYVTVSNSLFGAASGTATAHKITFNNFSSKITSEKTYTPIYANRINSKFFFIFQENTGNLDDKSLLLVKSDQLTDNANNDVTIGSSSSNNNYSNVDLSKLKDKSSSSSNKIYKTNIYYNSTTSSTTANVNILVSVPGQQNYLYANFEVNGFTFTTNPTVYEGYASGGFIDQVIPYYSLNNYDISGYYALTSTNQVISLDTSFKIQNTVYDFNSSYYNLGSIFKIYTIPGSASTTWYAQMTDGTFAKMSGSTLIGQWDKLTQNAYYEKTVDFTIKSESEVDSSVFFRKVVNDSGDGFDNSFVTFIGSSTVWKSFLDYDASSLDPQVTTPSVTVKIYNQDEDGYYFKKKDGSAEATNPLEKGKNNSLVLEFYQNLREIKDGVAQSTNTKSVLIGSYTYTFYYGAAKINGQSAGTVTYQNYSNYQSQTNLNIPQYVLDMYPSKIAALLTSTEADYTNFINSFLNMQNIVNPVITASGNDTNGTLTVNVTVPYSWASDNSSSADSNKTWVFTFGTSSSPFFKSNPFGFTDSTNTVSNASVTPVDNTFASQTANANTMSNLKNKYSTQLASSVSKFDLYNDFLVLGSAFSNSSYISSGLISPITEANADQQITVVPDDANGSAYISVTFPRIGDENDYIVSFTTPSIFMKDESASQSVYFSWKTGGSITIPGASGAVAIDGENTAISNIQPSAIGSLINNATSTSEVIQLLGGFATFSSYYANLITQNKLTVSATWSDKQGYLNITLTPQSGVVIPGIESSTNMSMAFYGFKADANASDTGGFPTTQTTSSFSFGTYSADANVSASSITQSDILSSNLLKDTSLSTWISSGLASITLTPSDSTGTLQVTVTLKNYSDTGTISPTKTFTTNIGGFKATNQNTNMIVWKTNTDSTLSGKLPSTLIESASTGELSDAVAKENTNLLRFKFFANISSVLNSQLTANPGMITAFTMQGDDTEGTLTLSAVIVQDGVSTVYSSTIAGLATTPSLQPTITFNYSDNSVNATLSSLKQQVPSTISTNNSNLLKLFTVNSTSPNYRTNVDLTYNDIGGTLSVKVTVYDSSNHELATSTQTYTGFKTVVDNSKSTNWTYVAISIVVPIIVLLIPVFLYGFIQERKDIKTVSRKLDSRLKEEQERERRMRLRLKGK